MGSGTMIILAVIVTFLVAIFLLRGIMTNQALNKKSGRYRLKHE